MKTLVLWFTMILILIGLTGTQGSAKVPEAGDVLVDMRLKTPTLPAMRAYLGLGTGDTFDPKAITGRLLVIEIFSMYCPHCQREAPAVNALFKAIETSLNLRGQVKMIGIGVGNSDFEVDHFRKHYHIQFPLFADGEFLIHQALGEVRTPFFIIVAIGSDDNGKVLWTGAGNLGPVETFINRLNDLIE